MDIITRAQWGARHGDGVGWAQYPASEIWLHHSVTVAPDMVPPWSDDYSAIRAIERIGAERFGTAYGFPYTFAVTPAGLVFEGHHVRKMGAHTYRHNDTGRGIVLVGNYEHTDPTDRQVEAVAALLRHGHAQGWWTTPALTGGHRDVKATACPGRRAYARIDEINYLAASGGGAAAPGGDDDMPDRQEFEFWVKNGVFKALLDPDIRKEVENTVWLDRTVKRGEAEIPAIQEVADAKTEAIAVRAKNDALMQAMQQLAEGREVDLDAVERAAEAGTRRALEEGTVDVDVTVRGQEGEQE